MNIYSKFVMAGFILWALHVILVESSLSGLWSIFFFSLQLIVIGGWGLPQQARQWHPTPALLPGKSHGWRSLVGRSPWGDEESDTTERLHFHFSLSCIGEGNGNPLQCSCLENPRDRGASWAAVYGVTQSWTRLKWLSSSSYISFNINFQNSREKFLVTPPGSSVHGFLQARTLEWVAMPSSRRSFWPRDRTWVSCTDGRFFTIWATIRQKKHLMYITCHHFMLKILLCQIISEMTSISRVKAKPSTRGECVFWPDE